MASRKEYFNTFGVCKPKADSQRDTRARFWALGICYQCFKNPVSKFKSCLECRKKHSEWKKLRKERCLN